MCVRTSRHRRFQRMEAQTHDWSGHVYDHIRPFGVQVLSVQVPHAHITLLIAPITIIHTNPQKTALTL